MDFYDGAVDIPIINDDLDGPSTDMLNCQKYAANLALLPS